jgi:hypothetical protein
MRGDVPVEIIGDAGIQAVVSAFQNIDNPVQDALQPFSMSCRGKNPAIRDRRK